MTLESGPAKADRNWQLLRTVIFLGFGLYFLYDGLYGYPRENRTQAEQMLATRPFNGKVSFDALREVPDKPDFEKLQQSEPAGPEQARQLFGQPTLTEGGDEFFISRYGYVKAPRGGRVSWHPWGKSRAEINGQFFWAIIPLAFALPFIWKLYRALTLRVVIDDQGLIYAGRRIAFPDMTSLRDYSPKGWIDLHYQCAGRERKLRLDNEKVARFDEIVAAVCQAKGFHNEVQANAERKAREEAAEAADPQEPEPKPDGSLLDDEYPKDS